MPSPPTLPATYRGGPLSVAVVMTGGTIAKTYDPSSARLANHEPKVRDLISELRTEDLSFAYHDLLHLDSLEIGPAERAQIVETVRRLVTRHDAILITHGTDSLAETAEALYDAIAAPEVPVVLTGAMVPYSLKLSDGVQNVTEALLALRLLPAGVYVSFHNRILALPGVRKDYANLTFEKV